jgi:threonine dehydrogenase-like Zn-dependent dehydrogenase
MKSVAVVWPAVNQVELESAVFSTLAVGLLQGLHLKAAQLIGGFVGMRPRVDSSPGRWTEVEDREAFLRLLQYQRLDVRKLITHRFDARRAPEVYEGIKAGDPSMIGVLLKWQ